MLDAHRRLLQQFPDLLLILVPRHPERFKDACNLTQNAASALPCAAAADPFQRHAGGDWRYHGRTDAAVRHRRSGLCRRQLVERGGHNPLEPAAHAIPVLMGPHIWNFKDICARLQQAEGLITVTDVVSLEKVANLLQDDDYRRYYGRHAVTCCTRIRAHCGVCYSYSNRICLHELINACRNANVSP